jgi:ketosteroid isomerase-like protein
MTTNDPLPTVQRMFEAFATGDLDRLLETVHPDSHWTYVGANPWPAKRVYVGREDVRKLFGKIIRNLSITTFHPRNS